MDKISVGIVDDHGVFVDSLSESLDRVEDFKVIYASTSSLDFIEYCETNKIPDVILLDISMPEQDGFETCKILTVKYPGIKIIALTGFKEVHYISKMVKAGAIGYLSKSARKNDIAKAIRKAIDVGFSFNNQAINVMRNMCTDASGNGLTECDFTERELEVINLICQELSTKEIAKKLFISDATVSCHKGTIFSKMNVKNAIGMAIYAIKHGIVK